MDLDPRLRPGGDGELSSSSATGVVSDSPPSPTGRAVPLQRGRDSVDTPSSSVVSSTPGQQHHQFDYAGDAGGGGGGGGTTGGGGGTTGGGGPAAAAAEGDGTNDAKKSRACEACRGLKVRCEPDPVEGEPCKRCRKAGRNCIVTLPTRKRQKKTDSRVSELEKKIDALTASLHARAGVPGLSQLAGGIIGQHQHQLQHQLQPQPQPQHLHQSDSSAGGYSSGWGNAGITTTGAAAAAAGGEGTAGAAGAAGAGAGAGAGAAVGAGVGGGGGGGGGGTVAVRSWGGMEASPLMQSAPTPPTRTSPDDASAFQPPIVMAGQKRKATDRDSVGEDRKASVTPSASWSGFSRPTEGDIVDRGLITMENAAGLFAKYKEHMVRHLPAVVFPPSTTVMELRKTKPTLFLAIMAAATGDNHSLQRVLQKELMQLFAEKVIVTGEKNLELVQAIHVAVIWYWPPEHFEELKFYQLVHIAAVMAIDIGLGRKSCSKRGPPPFRRNPPPDSSSIECRRTWLTCFFLALNTSMSLHRPNLVRWTPFMTESLEILETSPDAAPTDKYFCHLVWTHRLAEEVGGQFSLDDPSTMVNITDARTQYALRALERDLDKYIASIPKNLMQPGPDLATLRINFNVVNLYMHEMALHSDNNMSDQWRPPFNTEALKDGIVNSEPLSAAHINALSACLTAIDGIFNTFLSMEVLSIRCLPVFNFMRVAYGVVILIKMYFSASSPGSEMGKVIHKDNMRVEYYLEALLDKFRATAADNKCRPAAKFLVVLAMLRSWFFKQGKAEGGGSGPSLHGASPSADGGASSASSQQRHLSGTGRQVSQPFFHDSVSPPAPASHSSSMPQMPGPSPASTDLDSAMAPAFPPWMSVTHSMVPAELDVGSMPTNFDIEGLNLAAADLQDMYESGAKIVMNEPWFTDAFQGLPDPNLFPF
ncbi:hypothetical protein Trco_002127 [Trichoderma cornu-damae]|uniref:Zn(2)-C6 fungal-type domain-containing protein n=1 Tax=Trichoderma cornu-damae TaxID=654480 RepID=A0A9P8TUR2_9HYPO|nr:hypothetical protein Trco_002127 [Trichoderma cornu-damae]